MHLLPLGLVAFFIVVIALFYGPVPVRAWVESKRWGREGRLVVRENQSPVQLAIVLAPIGLGTLGLLGALVLDAMGVDGVILPVVTVALPLVGIPVLGLGTWLQVAPFPRRILVYQADGLSLREGEREVARQDVLDGETTRTGTRMGSHQLAVRMVFPDGTRWVVLRGPGVKVHWGVDHPVDVDDPEPIHVDAGILALRRLLSWPTSR